MFEISKTTQFKKDFKLIVKRNYDLQKFEDVLKLLLTGEKLPAKYKEHPLKNRKPIEFDCHIEPDRLLIFTRNIEIN